MAHFAWQKECSIITIILLCVFVCVYVSEWFHGLDSILNSYVPSLLICVWACVTFDLTYLPLPTQTNSNAKRLEEELRGFDQTLKTLQASEEKVYIRWLQNSVSMCQTLCVIIWCGMYRQTTGRMLFSSWILNTWVKVIKWINKEKEKSIKQDSSFQHWSFLIYLVYLSTLSLHLSTFLPLI